jgi:hypothetical protein
MADVSLIRYGADLLSLSETQSAVVESMLRRLPASLWNVDAATPQRELLSAVAAQCALWLEQRSIARTMTLLLEAQASDLDVLLQDYGLRRYLQHPDPYARQIGMQILWTPKATLFAIAKLADLLFTDEAHTTLRTGRGETHIFVSQTNPISTPYSYWGMVSDEGLWYSVTIDAEVPVISPMPPPGLDLSPGPHTLHWFTALDASSGVWYVTIQGDTLVLSQTQPYGYGTTEPFAVLSGQGERWVLTVDALAQELVATHDAGTAAFGYWRLLDYDTAAVLTLSIAGEVPLLQVGAPGGAADQTPGGTPLAWFQVADELGNVWYVHAEDDTLVVDTVSPGGVGANVPVVLADAALLRWQLGVQSGTGTLTAAALPGSEADLLVLSPGHPFEALRLVDSTGEDWWLRIQAGVAGFAPSLPVGATNVTPAGGPYRWLRAFDLAGTRWYISPSTAGAIVAGATTPGGLGTAQPTTLGDSAGVQWHWGVTMGGAFAVSNTPALDYGGAGTTVCLNDARGRRWFWRIEDGFVLHAPVQWPDSLDQSPWGELGWLLVPVLGGGTAYVYPQLNGRPTAAVGPPMTSPWGWRTPLTLYDTHGVGWQFQVLARTAGVLYWRLRDTAGALVYLWVQGEVPALFSTPPTGTDVTPGGQPLDWFVAYDGRGVQWYVTASDDTLVVESSIPDGVGSHQQPFEGYDNAGTLWRIDMDQGAGELVTQVVLNTQVVSISAAALPTIPAPMPGLALRDAVDAVAHIQAAGSLVTVVVS